MEISSTVIYQTKEFDKFKFVKGNRQIKQNHVQKLVKSIQRDNRLPINPIKVCKLGSNFGVLDGQHRFMAAKEMNIPIYFIVNPSPSSVAMIDDQIQESWALKDRLEYYVSEKIPEYVLMKKIMKEKEIPFSAFFALLGSHRYEAAKLFRDGKLKISDKIINFLNDSYEFRSYIHENCKSTETKSILYRRDFITALFWFYKKFPEQSEKLFEILKGQFSSAPTKADRETYERFFISRYNKVKSGKGLKHPLDELLAKQKNQDD